MASSCVVTPTFPSMRKKTTSAFSTAYSVCLLICCSILRVNLRRVRVQADLPVIAHIAPRVDQREFQARNVSLPLASIARRSLHVTHKRFSSPHETVEER